MNDSSNQLNGQTQPMGLPQQAHGGRCPGCGACQMCGRQSSPPWWYGRPWYGPAYPFWSVSGGTTTVTYSGGIGRYSNQTGVH